MGGRIIPRGEAEFRRHLRDGGSPETREGGSDDTEVMGTEPPGEPERDKRARAGGGDAVQGVEGRGSGDERKKSEDGANMPTDTVAGY